jgi:hypothetical protein
LLKSLLNRYSTLSRASSYLGFRAFIKLWHRLGLAGLTEKFAADRRDHHNTLHERNAPRPHKNFAKADDATPIGADFSVLEYAIQRKILEAPLLEFSYYTDVVGEVPSISEQTDRVGVDSVDIGNGDVAPEWGFDLIICGGFFKYGPWADRQR